VTIKNQGKMMVRAKWGESVISRLSCSEPKPERETKACFPLLKGYPDSWVGKCRCYSPTVFSYLWVLKLFPLCYLPQDITLVWLHNSMQTKVLIIFHFDGDNEVPDGTICGAWVTGFQSLGNLYARFFFKCANSILSDEIGCLDEF